MTNQDLQDWLKSGFFYNFSNLSLGTGETFLLGWGHFITSAQPVGDGPWLYSPDFYLENSEPWYRYENLSVISRNELTERLIKFKNSPAEDGVGNDLNLPFEWEMPKADQFQSALQTIQAEIKKGRLQKAVPVVFEKAVIDFNSNRRLHLILQILKQAGPRKAYGQWSLESGLVGATPEILFSCHSEKNKIKTMSLAGTRKSSIEKKDSLLNDAKEVFEQSLVTQKLTQKLAPYGRIHCEGPYAWDIGLISHLRTDIEVQTESLIDDNFIIELIKKLHPTPALGLFSDEYDFKWLKNIESEVDRARYGAPFGILNLNSVSEFAVAIRNVQWTQNEVLVGSGCGIVEKSVFEKEWDELKLKRKTVKDFLEL